MISQRDALINAVYREATRNRDIVFLSADFGAPALDRFRSDLPDQFVHMGISEQNMIDTAIGLSLRGKTVFAYAMAPFISMRAAEQHKLGAMMSANICVIVAGVGLGYANAGPTHYATEDFVLLNSIIDARVYTAADGSTAEKIAQEFLDSPSYSFVRLDREPCPELKGGVYNPKSGGRFLNNSGSSDLLVVTQGYATSKVKEWIASNQLELDHFDLIRSKPLSADFMHILNKYRAILVVDEQVPLSSLGTLIAGALAHTDTSSPIVRALSLDDCFMYENNGRTAISEKYGLSPQEFGKSLDTLRS